MSRGTRAEGGYPGSLDSPARGCLPDSSLCPGPTRGKRGGIARLVLHVRQNPQIGGLEQRDRMAGKHARYSAPRLENDAEARVVMQTACQSGPALQGAGSFAPPAAAPAPVAGIDEPPGRRPCKSDAKFTARLRTDMRGNSHAHGAARVYVQSRARLCQVALIQKWRMCLYSRLGSAQQPMCVLNAPGGSGL